MYLITKWFGSFIIDENEEVNKKLFPKDEKEIAKRLIKIEKNEILSEEKQISKNIKEIIVNEKRLKKIGDYKPKDPFFKIIDITPKSYNFSNELLQKATLILTKKRVDKDLSSFDLHVVQMVNALDDLIQTSNLLSERIDAWSILPKYKEKIQPVNNVFSTIKNEIKILEKQRKMEQRSLKKKKK